MSHAALYVGHKLSPLQSMAELPGELFTPSVHLCCVRCMQAEFKGSIYKAEALDFLSV